MASYQLYHLRNGQLVGSDHVEAGDDGDAVRIARQRGDGRITEIWNDSRRVRIVGPAKAASA
jgi:hypothetical protein